ncbi:MAG: TonB-dependent receptor [Rhodospirillaceae bacterium]|nr:TonB-dependent receptor [Rhodospirillaceae bacterium]
MTLRSKLALGASALAISASLTVLDGVALAQPALEEIVVTARKRNESLLEVPVAVTAFSADQLDRGGFTSLEDISFKTAGLHYNKQGGQIPGRFNTAVRFRGMDTNQSAASQQVGTVFMDGVYVSQGVAGIDFSTIERVEIIKGPQSATYGRSTFAGAVNYVTKTPGFEYKSRMSAEYGKFGTYDVALNHEGPLVEGKASYLLGMRGYGTDGQYTSNADGGALGKERTNSGTAILFLSPTDNFTAKARMFYSRDKDGPAAGMLLGSRLSSRGDGSANAGTNCFSQFQTNLRGATADYYCGKLPKVNVDSFIAPNTRLTPADIAFFRATQIRDPRDGITRPKIPGVPLVDFVGLKRNQFRAALNLDYDFSDGHTISSLTGFSDMRASWVRDFDLTRSQNFLSQDPQKHEDITQELRLTSPQDQALTYSVGLSYFKAEFIQQGNGGLNIWGSDGGVTQAVLNPNPPPATIVLPGPHPFMQTNFPLEGGKTLGVFGSIGYDITDNLTLDFEWRYQSDRVTQDDRTRPGTDFSDKFKTFLPRATLSFRPTDETNLWATYSKGNLPGFFNSDLAALSPADLAAVRASPTVAGQNLSLFNDEESLKNYELGWKQQLWDNRANFSLVGYKMDWTNLKTRSPVDIVDQLGVRRVLNLQFNAGNAKIKGVEFEGAFTATDNLSGTVSVNYSDAQYGRLTCGFGPFKPPPSADCSNNDTARFPKWSGSFSTVWTDDFSGDWDYSVRLDGEYFGKAWNEEHNFSWIGKFWRFNARAGFEKEGIRVEAYVKNLFDDDNYLAAARWSDFSGRSLFDFLTSQGLAVTPPQKRSFGLKTVMDF